MSKFYITTSIPYANGTPHLGHTLEFIQTDVLARYAKLQGKDVVFSTGMDEHGSKIKEKAESLNMDTMKYVDGISAEFKKLLDVLQVEYTDFIRTTDPEHEKRAKLIWKKLVDNGDIYKGSYEGWYCVGDEAFFSETEVKENGGICPNHKKPYQKIKEENYFFKLSKYTKEIKTKIENEEFLIIPETKRNEILSLVNGGLEDVSFSRPKSNVEWGIEVPGDPNQVMYVWPDALTNYLTVIGYPDTDNWKTYWPADVQVIGKDILRFHAAIWPGILLSLGLDLPKKLFVHGFIQIEGQKMGKSLGNGVAPEDLVNNYGVDVLRYYLMRHMPSYADGDFSLDHLMESYNGELANELGNVVQRSATMVKNFLSGNVGEIPPSEHDIAAYKEFMDGCRFDRALDEVWAQIRGINQYIDETKPWEVAKEKDIEHLTEILGYIVSSILEVATLLIPFMPNTASAIKEIFSGDNITPPEKALFPRKD